MPYESLPGSDMFSLHHIDSKSVQVSPSTVVLSGRSKSAFPSKRSAIPEKYHPKLQVSTIIPSAFIHPISPTHSSTFSISVDRQIDATVSENCYTASHSVPTLQEKGSWMIFGILYPTFDVLHSSDCDYDYDCEGADKLSLSQISLPLIIHVFIAISLHIGSD
jgi:hypothetical protein